MSELAMEPLVHNASAWDASVGRFRDLDSGRFVAGPAAAEIAIPFRGFLKFIGFIGTGLA